MICKKTILMAALLASIGASQAAQTPERSRYDARIQYVDYNEGDVVIVRATPGIGTRIVFDGKETIEDMATGFSDGWEMVNRGNLLYLKPKSVRVSAGESSGYAVMTPIARDWDTNLMVRTNKRLYDFDLRLVTSRGSTGASKGATYRVQFRYPQTYKSQPVNSRVAANPAAANWLYNMRVASGSEAIAPTAAYDDGRFTYLTFPNNREIPTVFLQAADKSESLVNSHMDGDTLVIHRVAPTFVLRLGQQVVGIYNAAYDTEGVPTPTGSSVPGMVRTIKKED